MVRPNPRGALGDGRREWLDANAQIGYQPSHDGDRSRSAAPRIHEDLRVGARRQDQGVLSRFAHGGHGRGVTRVARIEQGDDDARVENDYRHSRRSFSTAPFG